MLEKATLHRLCVTSGFPCIPDRRITTGWQRLLEYKWGALVEERGSGEYQDYREVRRIHIAAAGQALYEHDRARNHALYPDVVEALEPRLEAVRR